MLVVSVSCSLRRFISLDLQGSQPQFNLRTPEVDFWSYRLPKGMNITYLETESSENRCKINNLIEKLNGQILEVKNSF